MSHSAALPEDDEIHYELQDGVLVPMPSSIPEHQTAISEFEFKVRAQLPAGLRTVQDVDIDLQIVHAHRPGFVRRPDLAVAALGTAPAGETLAAHQRLGAGLVVAGVLAALLPRRAARPDHPSLSVPRATLVP